MKITRGSVIRAARLLWAVKGSKSQKLTGSVSDARTPARVILTDALDAALVVTAEPLVLLVLLRSSNTNIHATVVKCYEIGVIPLPRPPGIRPNAKQYTMEAEALLS